MDSSFSLWRTFLLSRPFEIFTTLQIWGMTSSFLQRHKNLGFLVSFFVYLLISKEKQRNSVWKPVWRQIVLVWVIFINEGNMRRTLSFKKKKIYSRRQREASDSITLRHKKSELYVNVWWIIKVPPIFWQPPTYILHVYIYLSANSSRSMCRDGRQFVIGHTTTPNSSCAYFSSNSI